MSHLFSLCVGNTLFAYKCRFFDSSTTPTVALQLQHSCSPSLPPLTVSILLLRFSVFQVVCSVHVVFFFLPHQHFSHFYMFCFLVFRIVCLSPVSRQWFYPMVGDIMLFYHRVEPRTGCWRVSASVRPSVRQSMPSSHKPPW